MSAEANAAAGRTGGVQSLERAFMLLETMADAGGVISLSQLASDAQLPLHHPVLTTVIWTVGLTLVMAPLAIRAFNRRVVD